MATTPSAHPEVPTGASVPPLRLSTIVVVEARKMIDTRGTRALLGAVCVLAAGALAWKLGRNAPGQTFGNYLGAASWIVILLVPVVGLLAMTSEWTQRTALVTFTLAPRRTFVLGAKMIVTTGCSLALSATVIAMSAGAAAIDGGTFDRAAGDIAGMVVVVVLHTAMAAGCGALAGLTAPALIGFLAGPTSVALVAGPGTGGVSRWVDLFAAYDQMMSPAPFDRLPETLVAVTLWVVLPVAFGMVRSVRREAK